VLGSPGTYVGQQEQVGKTKGGDKDACFHGKYLTNKGVATA